VTRALAGLLLVATLGGVARAQAPPADALLADLPFLDAADAAPAVRVDLAPPGGRALPLVLDTGSSESFATPRAAQELGISLRRSKQTPYRRGTRLGRDVELLVDTRRGDTGAAVGGEWAVLGGRFLARYVVEIDGPGRRVRFYDAERFAVPEQVAGDGAQVLPFALVGNRPVLEIEVGAARVPAVLATSAPGTLLLPGGWAAEAGVVPDPAATEPIPPLPGAGALTAMIAPVVRIGPLAAKDVPLLVAEKGAQGAGARSEAILGLELVRDAVLRIDYPRRRLWIAAAAPAPAAPGSGADRPLPSPP
jgi:hypothetical protein